MNFHNCDRRDNTGIIQGTQPRESGIVQVPGTSCPLSDRNLYVEIIPITSNRKYEEIIKMKNKIPEK
jgi:hypothetical protein